MQTFLGIICTQWNAQTFSIQLNEFRKMHTPCPSVKRFLDTSSSEPLSLIPTPCHRQSRFPSSQICFFCSWASWKRNQTSMHSCIWLLWLGKGCFGIHSCVCACWQLLQIACWEAFLFMNKLRLVYSCSLSIDICFYYLEKSYYKLLKLCVFVYSHVFISVR